MHGSSYLSSFLYCFYEMLFLILSGDDGGMLCILFLLFYIPVGLLLISYLFKRSVIDEKSFLSY